LNKAIRRLPLHKSNHQLAEIAVSTGKILPPTEQSNAGADTGEACSTKPRHPDTFRVHLSSFI
jgi:hypothetical protein